MTDDECLGRQPSRAMASEAKQSRALGWSQRDCVVASLLATTMEEGSPRLGPAFGKRQGAGAERAAFALHRPGLAGGVDAVARQPRAECRDQEGAHAVFSAALARVGVDQQRVADIVPGQGDVLAGGIDPLGPEIARVAFLAERRVDDRDRW